MRPNRMQPEAPTDQVRSRMVSQARSDTSPELALRRELFAMGLRYRIQFPVPGRPRRTIDIAFPRAKVAIFVDGCFWHGCPTHSVPPKHNADWWRSKLESNRQRDSNTTALLQAEGWTVLRFWEHEDPRATAAQVRAVLRPHPSTDP
ncbi:very short patch repair endonuclease [Actinomyces polynesiensis]|uniref:very short patch repair endonuclease n=1 Tax=Actinomyces polynesiensis TaxID=1325934 RepID=UPI002F3FE952